jgi:uncharacterized membrane protein
MELIKNLNEQMLVVVLFLEFILEAISIFCIFMGLLRTVQLVISMRRRKVQSVSRFFNIRLRLGVWLVLALEFQLAADILATTIAPSFEALGKVAVVAVIRTFLNYFLNQELAEEYEWREKHIKDTDRLMSEESIY